MDFSIILASRERPQLLTNLINSIKETTFDLEKVEVLVGIDNDDLETGALLDSIKRPFVNFHSRPRSHMLNQDYLNWLYNISTGKYIIACNDDCLFKTQNWDKIANELLSAYLVDKPDGVVYGYISDALINRQGMQYCCFPLVSRAGAEAVGFLMPPEIAAWGADIHLWMCYNSNGRVCNLSSIMIEHISYHSGKRERDGISYNVERISNTQPIHNCVNEHIEKLRRHLAK